MNHAVFIGRTGPPERLEIREATIPSLKPTQALVRTHAIGVNFADVVARRGLYVGSPKRPFTPGFEVAGVVERVGEAVDSLSVGERVAGLTNFGAYAQFAALDAEAALSIPDGMAFTTAAALPMNFVTAYHALFHTGLVRRGCRVLIHAAAGGVGHAAVQLARQAGAEVFGTASSSAKLDFLRELGVSHPINHREDDFATRVRELTQDEGVDVILDSVGGGQLRRDLHLLRPNGRLVSLGVSSFIGRTKLKALFQALRFPRANVLKLLQESQGIYGVNLAKLAACPELLRGAMQEVFRLAGEGVIVPVVHRVLPLPQAAEAHRLLESRTTIGKIVLTSDAGDIA